MNKYRLCHSIASPAKAAIIPRRGNSTAIRPNARRGALFAAMLACGTSVHAQTWENPLTFTGDVYSSMINTCAIPATPLIFDGQFWINAPTVVYRAIQLRLGRNPPPLRPWHVNLDAPLYLDLSVWVCQSKVGLHVDQCIDVADDGGSGDPEYVAVPAVGGFYYVVVTGGVAALPPVPCGTYTLTAVHW